MSRIFIIPDVHLKPWMFECASRYILKGGYDKTVVMGDLVDDWDQGLNLDLYNETFDAAVLFAKNYPDTLWCYGNHDLSYVWRQPETGYSVYAHDTVVDRLKELENTAGRDKFTVIHRIDQVLFSHGGLTGSFIDRHFADPETDLDDMIAQINSMGDYELWVDDSPLWARPQYGDMELYKTDLFQVVGHTPVNMPLYEKNLLTVDTFSTYRDGTPIGTQSFTWIDSVTFETGEN